MPRLLALLVVGWAAAPTLAAAAIETTETSEGILFTENGVHVLFYQRAAKTFEGAYTRNNYVHPVWDLDGGVLTEDAPEDHPHQRGIFWAWHQVRVGNTRLGDAWECRDFEWHVVEARVEDTGEGAKRLVATVLWKSSSLLDEEQRPRAAVRETMRLTVHPRSEGRRFIDVGLELLALVEGVTLGGSEDEKGYGGFSVRLRCPEDLVFLSTAGVVEPRTAAVAAGPWLDFVGSFNHEQVSGLAVLCHPGNPDPADRWILRRSRSMQNAVYPGRGPVPISTRQPTRLRYRVVIHQGALAAKDVAVIHDQFSASAP